MGRQDRILRCSRGCILAVFIVSQMEKLPFSILLDALAPGTALSIAVMRMMSFFNGFYFGRVIKLKALRFFPVGVYVESIRSWLYAVFVYEAVYCLLLFVLLMLTRKKMKHDGDAAWWLALLYGCGGVLFENIRADSLLIGFVKVSQVAGMVMVLFCPDPFQRTRGPLPGTRADGFLRMDGGVFFAGRRFPGGGIHGLRVSHEEFVFDCRCVWP
jgi:hypothetical protein